MKKIQYKGYTISQASNNHIMICKNDEMVFHASGGIELDEEGLKGVLDFYLKFIHDSLDDLERL